ncbi:MAG: hypothetical protein ACLP50_21380 [Solirubrobacteraceae bacterium]
MVRRIMKSSDRRIAMAVAGALLGVLGFVPAGLAAVGTPSAGANCQYQDGKISGRGSTLQTWLQYDLMSAYAADVCGAVASQAITYVGSGAGGSSVTFTVGSDGTVVNSYEVSGAHGTEPNGSGCTVNGAGDAGVWPGAPITANAFVYDVGTAINFQGTFSGTQAASGTFSFDDPAQGEDPGCDTGTVAWTAALTTNQPAGTNGGDITHPLSPIYNLNGGSTYDQNWMTAYNEPDAQVFGASGANTAIGSGAGETAIGCFAEAFTGTDIPASATQLDNIDGGTYTGSGAGIESNGGDCNATDIDGALVEPFTPLPSFPNPGDSATFSPSGVMVFPIGVSAVSVLANLPSGCIPASGLHLSNADQENIWGGAYTNWDQVTDAGIVAGSPCTTAGGGLSITRVARNDNAGTTQAMDNYLADISNDGSSGICSANTNPTAASFKLIQNHESLSGTDVNWPTGAGCSTLYDSESPGDPALIAYLQTVSGAIGYADLADAENDTNNFQSQVSGDTIAQFAVQASNSATNFQPPRSGSASNCSPSDTLPGGGTDNAMVGIASGGWDLTAETAPNQGPDDIGYAREGATYPICSLTWDMVWTGDDGDVANGFTPAPANLNAVSAGATSIALDPTSAPSGDGVMGVPNSVTSGGDSGSITVAATGGTDTISYTGFNGGADTLTGVSGVTNAIPAETTFTYPSGTGGPEANLTADQRRSLYSYFTYVESPAAQATEAGAGYAQLPSAWVSAIRSGFQSDF